MPAARAIASLRPALDASTSSNLSHIGSTSPITNASTISASGSGLIDTAAPPAITSG
jgi:hypothetical protein